MHEACGKMYTGKCASRADIELRSMPIRPRSLRSICQKLGQTRSKITALLHNPSPTKWGNKTSSSVEAPIDQTIRSILDGIVDPAELPPINVFQLDGRLYSMNNRRLYVLWLPSVGSMTCFESSANHEMRPWFCSSAYFLHTYYGAILDELKR